MESMPPIAHSKAQWAFRGEGAVWCGNPLLSIGTIPRADIADHLHVGFWGFGTDGESGAVFAENQGPEAVYVPGGIDSLGGKDDQTIGAPDASGQGGDAGGHVVLLHDGLGQDLDIVAPVEGMPLILHGGDDFLGVDDVAAEGHGDVPEAGLPGHGLAFPETHVADAPVPFEIEEVLFREGVPHLAVVGYLVDMTVKGGNAAIFLPPVLEEIDAVVNVIDAGKLRIDPEYAAIVFHFTHLLFPYLMSA